MAVIYLLVVLSAFVIGEHREGEASMQDMDIRIQRLREHLEMLTRTIGERSVATPANLAKSADYIHAFYKAAGLSADRQPDRYGKLSVDNVVAQIDGGTHPKAHYLVGAHYDSVAGTVGADDNASAVAVQLETARELQAIAAEDPLDLTVTFVSFALEEPPVYGTRYMGSRVYARELKARKGDIDGMICLEMVGYTCAARGCQHYPFPLSLRRYPKDGRFIGIVGNWRSRSFSRSLVSGFAKNADLPVIQLTVPFNGYILPSVRLSDHASFWDQGFKAVMITDTAFYRNPHYHRSSDTMETLDFEFMSELVESLLIFFRSQGDRRLK